MQKIGTKLIIIAMICLVFLVGMFFISGLVSERQAYHQDVIDEIKSSHVSEQIMVTPFLLVQRGDKYGYVFAKNSNITTQANVRDDEYQRGIYQVVSYRSKVAVHQSFDPKATVYVSEPPKETSTQTADSEAVPSHETATNTLRDAPQLTPTAPPAFLAPKLQTSAPPPSEQPSDQPLTLIIAINDLRGVAPTDVMVNGNAYPTKIGTGNALKFPYLQVDLPISERDFAQGVPLDVQFELDVAGIGSFGVMPVGENTQVSLSSDWPNPKFTGVLPNQKSITKDGFSATWHSPMLGQQNQSYVIQVSDLYLNLHNALMSEFVQVNDVYTLTDRSIKYALLIVMVSFAVFFLFEVIKARRIHPIQYLLVASALLVFYLLLLSLAEQIAFLYAYLIASVACVSLIGWYACYMLGSVRRGLGFGVVLGALYVSFYVILSASELNLLLGSVFCFVFIVVVMAATRHVDWYGVNGVLSMSANTTDKDVSPPITPTKQGENDD